MSEMKTVRTSELIGAALDWAVGLADRRELELPSGVPGRTGVVWCEPFEVKLEGKVIGHDKARRYWSPSTDWSQGGPLIGKHGFDFEWIGSDWHGKPIKQFCANGYDLAAEGWGDTHLIAACRAIVISKFGSEIQIPAELLP